MVVIFNIKGQLESRIERWQEQSSRVGISSRDQPNDRKRATCSAEETTGRKSFRNTLIVPATQGTEYESLNK